MGELGVLFNPGMRHEQEEKAAKQMMREDEGTGRKGRLGIDLESGTVVIGAERIVAPEPESSVAERMAVEGQVEHYLEEVATAESDAASSAAAALAARETSEAASAEQGATAARHPSPSHRGARTSAHQDGGAAARKPSGKARRGNDSAAGTGIPTGKFRRGR